MSLPLEPVVVILIGSRDIHQVVLSIKSSVTMTKYSKALT